MTNDYQAIAAKIKEADALVIGASNGLSISEGIHLFANNAAFHELFGDLESRYGITCLLQGMMGRWPSVEQLWGFWSRMIGRYHVGYTATPMMEDLRALVGEKPHFVVTSNGEGHFQAAGFAPEDVYELEGDWTHLTCARRCSGDIVSADESIRAMTAAEQGGVVSASLIPRCAHCGAPLIPTMAAGVADPKAEARYAAFLERFRGKRIVFLELGVGVRNQLIKAPFMRLTAREPNATYVTFNLGELYVASEIAAKSFTVEGYLNETLAALRKACEA